MEILLRFSKKTKSKKNKKPAEETAILPSEKLYTMEPAKLTKISENGVKHRHRPPCFVACFSLKVRITSASNHHGTVAWFTLLLTNDQLLWSVQNGAKILSWIPLFSWKNYLLNRMESLEWFQFHMETKGKKTMAFLGFRLLSPFWSVNNRYLLKICISVINLVWEG